ncbi:uncharacterized protein DS421_9g274120 [Arachis hypogaea]|nr:uncharacterized protein DS421_9g274120 [Arachis hypogaea]
MLKFFVLNKSFQTLPLSVVFHLCSSSFGVIIYNIFYNIIYIYIIKYNLL